MSDNADPTARKAPESIRVDGHDVRFTNPDKVMYPETGTTKHDVLDYYLRIAPLLIPQSAWRPATRKRWVSGVGTRATPGQVFFRKDLEKGAPTWLPTAEMVHRKSTNTYPLANNAAVLAWFAQMAALEIHVPQWRFDAAGEPCNPDRLVIDLDPGPGVNLAGCAEVALWVKRLFDDLGMTTYPVTSGSKGIHLYIPLDGTITSEDANGFARKMALDLQDRYPSRVIAVQKRAEREGKVLLDWSQNSPAKTTVCPYSLRGRSRPMVAAPRTWDEIQNPALEQLDYQQVLARATQGFDPLKPLGWYSDSAPPLVSAASRSGPIERDG